jgi:phosphate transport system substrate-binding protein
MKRTMVWLASLSAISLLLTACGGAGAGGQSQLTGKIMIDGSSTVYPITEAVAEEFRGQHPGVQVTIGVSGSSGGFKKWTKGETDINNSSRQIKQSEIDAANQAGFGHVEIPVAYDGLSVVVSQSNTWLTCITEGELQKIWNKDSKVKRWNEVNPSWPNEEIKLYGAGTESGTFEYFTEHINGQTGNSRADYTASEDDNTLVLGVAGNKNSLGYFGYSYYHENKAKIRAVAVDAGKGCIEPTNETISSLSYPIARLIYIYPTKKSLERPEVKEFITFYLKSASTLVPQTGYTALPQKMYDDTLAMIK